MNVRRRKHHGGVGFWLVPRLAWADLLHDWILSSCLVLALSAVIAPLLLLFGLKFGYIQTLRERLIQNPANREIRPLATVDRSRDWFRQFAAQPEVGFMVPSIRAIAAPVLISRIGATGKDSVDLIPTSGGDPLLIENHKPIPHEHEVVLTAMTAQAINAKTGDQVTLTALRGDRDDHATVDMKVVAVLPMTASGVKGVYAPLPILEAVEAYKDGRAIPELGWPGSLATANPVYDGAIIIVSEALSPEKQSLLRINTGFSYIDEIEPGKLAQLAGWSLAAGHTIYHLRTELSPVHRDSIAIVKDQLRGLRATVIPWVRPLQVIISAPGIESLTLKVQGLSVVREDCAALGLSPVPPWGDSPNTDLEILLPAGVVAPDEVQLVPVQGRAPLSLPVKVRASTQRFDASALVPSALAGIIRQGQSRRLGYDRGSGKILLQPLGYAGFRLYARTIDDVETLRRRLAEEGLNVSTEAQQVANVTELDHNLTRVFALIALTGIGGGMAALVANLYASVERKRRELGTLRLIGFSRRSLANFPVFQALLLVATGFGCATCFFFVTSQVIDHLFRNFRQPGESFCRLPPEYIILCLVCSLTLGMLASSIAAYRVSRASAAEALRDG
jgi:putative ABC transport system permease protein